jgi:wyosine [tRNA(Phe)-imidazoG37] synthetase (radical SAM superfamily)/predicted Fe-Mo cluster-binding NifX family protein
MRVAVPICRGRVSPVLDVAQRLRIIEVRSGKIADSTEYVMCGDPSRELSTLAVDVVICAGVSRELQLRLGGRGVGVLAGFCGSVNEVITAYLAGRLRSGEFTMPGSALPHRGIAAAVSMEERPSSMSDESAALPVPIEPDTSMHRLATHVFGPVPSRRLGCSLGIDPLLPKTCNFDCVYCQLGRTRRRVSRLRNVIPAQEIIDQVREDLQRLAPAHIDWVTFVGSGETCLYPRLGRLIAEVRDLSPLPIAVITNGSLLYRPEVRKALLAADAVLPSLDAGAAALRRRINRPHPVCTFQRHVEGLVTFRRQFKGRLWLETMLVAEVNDSEQALADIAAVAARIEPDEIHIGVPTRPPAENWVRPPGREALSRALEILGSTARVIAPSDSDFELVCDPVEEVLRIISRHPMREEELERSLSRYSQERVQQALESLRSSGRVKVVQRLGARFWSGLEAEFPDA